MNSDSQTSIFRRESLERLSSPEQLDQLMQVVNARSWLSLVALASLVGLAVGWSVWGRLSIMATGRAILVHPTSTSDKLVGLTYFEPGEGDRIQPGMEVTLIPDAMVEQTEGVTGRVKMVAASPLTTLDEARRADPTALQPEAIEVLVELDSDSATQQSLNLTPGMTATARITLARKAPITLAFPFLETTR